MNSETKNTLSTANNSNADNINLQKKRMRTGILLYLLKLLNSITIIILIPIQIL